MKTKSQVLKEFSEYKVLINAVISRIGMESVQDVLNHGINGGFSGFIYYSDTHKFAMTYRKKIFELLEEEAKQLGMEVIELVAGFGVFRGSPMDAEDQKEVHEYINGGTPESGTITNVMAWFCAEEVCRFFDDTEYL